MKKAIIALGLTAVTLLVSSFFCFAQADPYLPNDFANDPSFPKPEDKSFIEQTVNGITVRITNLKKRLGDVVNFDTGKTEKKWIIEIDVCHSIPDSGEWHLLGEEDMLKFKDVISKGWECEWKLSSVRQPDGEDLGEQCFRFKYEFDPQYRLDPPIELTFSRMFSTPRE